MIILEGLSIVCENYRNAKLLRTLPTEKCDWEKS